MATDVVLFDLGGVLIELAGAPVLGRLAGVEHEEDVWRRWLTCPWVRRFERGQCTPDEFARGVVTDWQLELAPEEFLRSFRAWPRGLYPGADALLGDLSGRVRRACFSNSNGLHWPRARDEMGLGARFERCFLSHEMGRVKPDADAFEHVVGELGCRPQEILFLDDNQINVDAARSFGLDAERVLGTDAARALLVRRGILA